MKDEDADLFECLDFMVIPLLTSSFSILLPIIMKDLKQERRHIRVIILPVITKPVYRFEKTVNKKIACKFRRVTGTFMPAVRLVRRIVDTHHRRTDVVDFRTIDQLLHIRNCQTPSYSKLPHIP